MDFFFVWGCLLGDWFGRGNSSSDLPEELGRVEVLLSDKTGTLTQNDMSFKKLHLGTVLFGRDSHEDLVEAAYVAFGGSVAEIVAAGEKAVDGSAAILSSSGENPRRGRMVTEVTPVGMASGVISTTTKTTAVGAANEAATSYLNEGGPRMSKTQAVRRLHGRVKEALLAIALAHNVTPAEEHGQRTMQAAVRAHYTTRPSASSRDALQSGHCQPPPSSHVYRTDEIDLDAVIVLLLRLQFVGVCLWRFSPYRPM